MSNYILPILNEMGIAKENLPMDKDISLLANNLDNISNEEIIYELKENINILFNKNINKSR